jgi:phage gp29-like protein
MAEEQAVAEQAKNNGQPVWEEIATVERDIFRGYIGNILINPDQVLKTEAGGKGLQLYEELERDGQVYSTLQTRKLAIINKEWEVIPASDRRADKKIAEFVEENLRQISFDQARTELLDALVKGYAVSEIMWAIRGGKVVIKELRGRDPRRFTFDLQNRLRMLTLGNLLEGEPVPARKFVVHIFQMKFYSPFGKGLGEKLYWPVWFKKHGIKFWVLFCEKFGMPTAVGKYPPGTPKEQQDALLEVLESIQQDIAIKIPENMIIELLEAQRSGTINTYEGLCKYMDYQISKVVLGQTLTTEVGDKGSYAAGKVHEEVRLDICKADCDALCETLNKQLIIPLVDYNFAGVEAYPEVWCRCEEEKDLKPLAERDKILVRDVGLPVGEQYFYDTYGIPQPAEGEELVAPPAQPHSSPSSPPMEFAERKPRHVAHDGEIEGLYEAAREQGKELFAGLNRQIIDQVKKSLAAKQ